MLELPHAAEVKGGVFDVSGREVARLGNGHYAAGVHTFVVDGARAGGWELASGVYFARVAVVGSGASQVLRARAIVLR